jgi:glucose/arabinose dehydrogenase
MWILLTIILTSLILFGIIYYSTNSTEFEYNSTTEQFEVRDANFKLELVADNLKRGLQHVTTFQPTGDNSSFYIIFIKLMGRGILVLRSDTFEQIDEFGTYPGTCIQAVGHHLYVGGPANVYRYDLDPGTGNVLNKESPDLVIRGLKGNRMSDSPIFIVNPSETKMYVHVPSLTNACQPISADRKRGKPGELPCSRTMMDSGVWLFDPRITNHTLETGSLIATGIRKMRALALNKEERVFGIIQGRDFLNELYPHYYSKEEGDLYGSDELVEITPNTNFGHPYCYWDGDVYRFKLNPEYGGDGRKAKQCNSLITKPLAAFNGHMGPNDVLFNTVLDWGPAYEGAMFVAWNGRPSPMRCNKTCANLYVSTIAFNESMIPQDNRILIQFDPEDYTKPAGICATPDGAMLISDSLKGKLYKLSKR